MLILLLLLFFTSAQAKYFYANGTRYPLTFRLQHTIVDCGPTEFQALRLYSYSATLDSALETCGGACVAPETHCNGIILVNRHYCQTIWCQHPRVKRVSRHSRKRRRMIFFGV